MDPDPFKGGGHDVKMNVEIMARLLKTQEHPGLPTNHRSEERGTDSPQKDPA